MNGECGVRLLLLNFEPSGRHLKATGNRNGGILMTRRAIYISEPFIVECTFGTAMVGTRMWPDVGRAHRFIRRKRRCADVALRPSPSIYGNQSMRAGPLT